MARATPAESERRSWIGQSVKRFEDSRFLTGSAEYLDDIVLPGMLHVAMLRSPYPHALIRGIDYSRALEIPGVRGVITGEDVAALAEPEKGTTFPAGGSHNYIASDRVRFVGEIVALVAAEDRYIAEDALEAIEVEYEELPAVLDPERATEPDQPVLHPGVPGGNEVLHQVWDFGDVDRAFADADVVVSERYVVYRHSSTPVEGLASIASYDRAQDKATIWSNAGNLGRYILTANALGLETTDLRLIVPDVGGSFGVKAWVHQRSLLLAILSRKVGRPVKWVEDRVEHLKASHHGLPRITYIDMAAKSDGTILGMKMRFIDDQGAYVGSSEPAGPGLLLRNGLFSTYRFRNARIDAQCVHTNTCPIAAMRARGRIQPVFAVERAIDRVAKAIGMDPAEVRRVNLLRPEEYPYLSPSKALYDSGDPPALLKKTRELLDYDNARRQQQEARREGRLLGIGLAFAVELGGPTPDDVATVQLTPQGRLVVQTPTIPQGQGHETTIAQIVADRFDLDPVEVSVNVKFDSEKMTFGPSSGTYGSRFVTSAGPAVHGAAKKLADRLAVLAATLLDADPKEIQFRDGNAIARRPDRSVSLRQIAERAHRASDSFGLESAAELEATFYWSWPNVYPDEKGNRTSPASFTTLCHGAVVEVDPETGIVEVLKYVASEDCGRIINPMVVRGMAMGGIVNGLGWAFTEKFVYNDDGQLVTTTFMDYLPPRFTDIPPLHLAHIESPSPFSPLGAKGMGEGGAIPPTAVMANAVEDAMYHLGGRIVESHLSPEVVFQAIRRAAAS